MVGDDRGQALTLEAITAAILMLAAVGFALQMTAVTPLSASTSSQHLENQLQATGEGVLASSAQTGALQEALLFWNEENLTFHHSRERPFYTDGPPPNAFGQVLNGTYENRNIAYNVVIYYQTPDGGIERQRLVHQGEPSDHAVSSSRTVTLSDDDRLVLPDGSTGPKLGDIADSFYAPDASPMQPLYNLIRVEVVAWRI